MRSKKRQIYYLEKITMNALNTVILIGNLGADPELRYFESGSVKAKLSIARRISAEVTDWVPVELWGKAAEIAANYTKKGSKIEIKGSLKQETWTDSTTGEPKSRFVIVAWQINLHSKSTSESTSIDSDN